MALLKDFVQLMYWDVVGAFFALMIFPIALVGASIGLGYMFLGLAPPAFTLVAMPMVFVATDCFCQCCRRMSSDTRSQPAGNSGNS